MKILINCTTPFMLAHGGTQIQIERTKSALERIGVETDYLRWWDEKQTGDLIHHFCAIPGSLVRAAQIKGPKVVNTMLLSETCNRPPAALWIRKAFFQSLSKLPLPSVLTQHSPWRTHQMCDRMIVGLHAEQQVLEKVYGVDPGKISEVPLGLTESFLKAGPAQRTEQHLISTGAILPVKRSLELARLAREAEVPILFVGKPSSSEDPYWRSFARLIDEKFVKYHPHVGTEVGLIELLLRSRGFALFSRFENWCLAAHEAAACGLPLLLPDKNWSRERFGTEAVYWPEKGHKAQIEALRNFYEQSAALPAPRIKLFSWIEVAEILRKVYEQTLNTR